jgi:YD repeat-containing protein
VKRFPNTERIGWLSKVTDPENFTEEYQYHPAPAPAGLMRKVIDKRANTMVVNEYYTSGPNNGRVQRQTLADSGVYGFTYTTDSTGKITQTDVTNPRGIVRRMSYHASGYLASDTRALGQSDEQTLTYERDALSGLVRATVDALARRTEYDYDDRGNVKTIRRLGVIPAVVEQFTYTTDFNQIATYSNGLEKTWTYRYFPFFGLLKEVEDPLMHKTQFTYNASGQLSSVTNALNKTTGFGYDLFDLRTVTDPLMHTTTYFTDIIGRVKSLTDAVGNTTQFEYDQRSLKTRIIDPANGVTTLGYDQNGNLTSVLDAQSGLTAYTYDLKNRRDSRTDARLKTERTLYNQMNNPENFTDRKGQITGYQYDPLDRLKLATYPDLSTTTYGYGAGNRLRTAADSLNGTITRAYDNLDRLTQELTPQGRLNYTYDAASRRATMTVFGQPMITYGYDDANRLQSITQGGQVQLGYDDANRRTSVRLPNGVDMIYDY